MDTESPLNTISVSFQLVFSHFNLLHLHFSPGLTRVPGRASASVHPKKEGSAGLSAVLQSSDLFWKVAPFCLQFSNAAASTRASDPRERTSVPHP